MRKYEAMIILQSNLEEDVRNAEIEKLKGIITSFNGTVDNYTEWGQRKLAYEIDKKREGFYIILNFTAGADAVNELDRICKISDNVLRNMTIVEESN